MAMDLSKHCIVRPSSKLRLKHRDPDETFGKKRDDKAHEKTLGRLRELQHLLYADKRYALLIILQALDAGGKDGTIRNVMSGVNPQGCEVVSFKAPTTEELAHDFLWRIHRATPNRGNIGIFNRSHYEDVLIVRVHGLVPKEIWHKRYRQINEFEQMLTENGVTILKSSCTSAGKSRGSASRRASKTHREIGSSRCRISRNASIGTTTPKPTKKRCIDAAPNGRRGTLSRRIKSGSATAWWRTWWLTRWTACA